MKIEHIQIGDLKPYEKNAKTHPKKQVDLLAENITRFGFTTPCLVDKDNNLIAGHGRLEAVKTLGWADVPCVRMENLTPDEVKALRLADNKLAEMSEWDMGIVTDELKELDDDLFDLTGFDKDLIIEPDEADDEVPDVPEEPQSNLGDLYELGSHRVLCGDSTKIEDVERLMDGKKADMVFTDPPYGYSYKSNHYKNGNPHGMLENDDTMLDFLPSAIYATENNSSFYIFCGWQNAHEWREYVDKCDDLTVKNMIVWKKNNWSMGDLKGAYAGQYELCLFAHRGHVELANGRDRDVWEVNRESATLHPTTKPVDLALRAMKNHTCNRILDLFLGSGSTLIASEKTGRICYGMELDPKYVDVIVQRYLDYVDNPVVYCNGEDVTTSWKKTTKKSPTSD